MIDTFSFCRECHNRANGEDGLCEDCRHIRDDDFANIGMYVSDSGEILDIEPREVDLFEPEYCYACGRANSPEATECSVCQADFTPLPSPVIEEQGQAWIEVDGQRVTPDDVRRLANLYQQTRWAWILSGIAENKAQQIIRRLEYELSDCGDAPTYSITPKGYELLRELAV